MTSRAFRIKVRGEFKELTPDQRADLLASDLVGSLPGPEGTQIAVRSCLGDMNNRAFAAADAPPAE